MEEYYLLSFWIFCLGLASASKASAYIRDVHLLCEPFLKAPLGAAQFVAQICHASPFGKRLVILKRQKPPFSNRNMVDKREG